MPIKVIMPQFDLFMTEGTIVKWLKKDGEKVEKKESVALIETSKVEAEVESPATGTFYKTQQIGTTLQVGETIALIVLLGEEVPVENEVVELGERLEEKPLERIEKKIEIRIFATPLAKRLAKEHNIDLSKIMGTGSSGMINKEDIFSYIKKLAIPEETSKQVGVTEKEEIIPLVGWRKTMAEHVSYSMRSAAQITTIVDTDVTELVELREKLKKNDTKINYTAFFVKAVTQALQEYPILNSSLVDDKIVIKKYYNIGVAVAREKGLVVPVVYEAEKKSLLELTMNINELSEKARSNKLSLEDIRGRTFSITSTGNLGVLMNTPIINYPDSAILGIGAIIKRPSVVDNKIVIRSKVYLCLTYDHRVIDGAPSIRFLQKVKQLLENPHSFFQINNLK